MSPQVRQQCSVVILQAFRRHLYARCFNNSKIFVALCICSSASIISWCKVCVTNPTGSGRKISVLSYKSSWLKGLVRKAKEHGWAE